MACVGVDRPCNNARMPFTRTAAGSPKIFCMVVMLLSLLNLVCSEEFAGSGPCKSTASQLPFLLPAASQCGWRCHGQLHVTTPAPPQAGGTTCPYAGPYPLIIFISAFVTPSQDYRAYSEHLASWGFAVMQYDFDLGGAAADGVFHTDEEEVGFLRYFLNMLQDSQSDPSSPLYGKLDLSTLGTAGHSRGGKIAALHYAGDTPDIKAAYLVDPVDGTCFTASQQGYPSAVEALRGKGKQLGITGAGHIGPCNGAPIATGNWSSFWEVAANGSWLEGVPGAGHLQFADIPAALDLVCCWGCKGLISHEEGMSLAVTPMTAWFDQQLRAHAPISHTHHTMHRTPATDTRPSSSSSSSNNTPSRWLYGSSRKGLGRWVHSSSGSRGVLLGESAGSFKDWVCEEEAAGKITFTVKGHGDICDVKGAALA